MVASLFHGNPPETKKINTVNTRGYIRDTDTSTVDEPFLKMEHRLCIRPLPTTHLQTAKL